jgi:hypothetical protein
MTSWRANQRGSGLDGVVVAGWTSALSNFFGIIRKTIRRGR